MGLFDRIACEGGVFKNERALLPEWLPEVLPHREREIREIALAVRPAALGKRPENIVLIGPAGTGKTSCVKHVFKELAAYSQRALPIYINCWELPTRHAILSKLAQALGEILPRRGIGSDEIIEQIAGALRRERRVPVLALDELDRLLANPGESGVLYDLARARETLGSDVGLIGITNNEAFFAELDERVRSSLGNRSLIFKPYTPPQLKDILRERAREAFFEGCVDADAIAVCAAHGAKHGGDARVAIEVLWRAGREAEREGAKVVSVQHVRRAIAQAQPEPKKLAKPEVRLNEIEQRIIDFLKKRGEVTSGQLYAAFGHTDRYIRAHIDRLEKLGIIETRILETKEETGGRGKTRAIRLKH
ncbi:MAG: AAA family ATPase [Candidatus Micrarchaeia archaeon]